jgi:hypothetical protein
LICVWCNSGRDFGLYGGLAGVQENQPKDQEQSKLFHFIKL